MVMAIDMKALGRRIRVIRKSKGLTMEEFGKLANDAHKSLVSKWESGGFQPNPERTKKIAEIGGISVDELLHGKDELSKFTTAELLDELQRRNSL